MEVNILQVLSEQQREIYVRACKGETLAQIGESMGVSKNTVKKQWARIKDKIKRLDENDVDVIMDIFEEEIHRTLPKNHTIGQVQFLSQTKTMHTETIPQSTRYYYRSKTRDIESKVNTRKMTAEEREYIESRIYEPRDQIPRDVMKLDRLYKSLLTDPNANTETMARMEVILRAFGVIYLTPAINKLNAKTTKSLRAKEEGYKTTLIKPGEGVLLPQGSKFLESVKDQEGNSEYAVWLVPKGTRILAQVGQENV